MQDSQTTALDLPQKMLVYEDGSGVVRVAYNDPSFLADRHSLSSDVDGELSTIAGALQMLSSTATEN